MTEASEVKPAAEHVEILSAEVRRTLLLIRGRSGLLEEPLNEFIVANQRQFGRDTDDYASMVLAHQTNTFPGSKENEIYLGIHEEVRRKVRVVIDDKPVDFLEAVPEVRNIWVGDNVQLLTAEQAGKKEHEGRTALDFAKSGGEIPEMVVWASDCRFYPATARDIVVSAVKR